METVCTGQKGVRLSTVSKWAVEPDEQVRYKTPEKRAESYEAVGRVLARYGVNTGIQLDVDKINYG